MCVTGVVQRSISSTAPGISDGSSTSCAHWSGWSMSAKRAERDQVAGGLVARDEEQEGEVQQVVVGELGAVDLGGGQDRQHVVFAARARRAAMSCWKYSNSSPMATNESISISGSAFPVHASDQRRNCSQSSGGAPSSSAIIRVGRGAAISSANSWVEPDVDVVEDPVDDLAHLRLEDGHLPPGEAGVDQLAQLPVPRRVGEDEVALLHRVRHHRVGDGDALGRGEHVRVARHVADVLVLQQRPELR